jgi:hypothetical protein
MGMLFPAFYSSIETVFIHASGKVVRWGTLQMSAICCSAYIPPTVDLLPDALLHPPCNIRSFCRDSCFEFLQHIHSLAIHLVFHMAPKQKPKAWDQENESELSLRLLFSIVIFVFVPELQVFEIRSSILVGLLWGAILQLRPWYTYIAWRCATEIALPFALKSCNKTDHLNGCKHQMLLRWNACSFVGYFTTLLVVGLCSCLW